MVTTSALIAKLKESVKIGHLRDFDAVLKKELGLGNRPDIFHSRSIAESSAKNQARTTKQFVEILAFYELEATIIAIPANHADGAKMKKVGFKSIATAYPDGSIK